MVDVKLWGSMKPFVGGHDSVEVQATTIRDLLKNLVEAHPGLADHAERGIAVSIDGVIYQNSHNQPIPEGAEVYLLPRLRGG